MFRFYDDELHNLILVANRNFKEIIDYTSIYDFHPPGQYIVNKISLQFFGLNEFWLSVPSIVFLIIAIAIASKFIFNLTGSLKYSITSGLIIALNPLILLWGSSIRWYPLWTFLAVLSIYSLIKLFSQSKENTDFILKSILIITLTFSLYTNYQTITLVLSFLITALLLDLQDKKKKYYHLKLLTPVVAVVIILFIPYINVFRNHLETFIFRKEIYEGFSGKSPFVAGGYFLFSIIFGNSIYPWDYKFITLIFIAFTSGLGILLYYKTHFSYSLKTYIQTFISERQYKSFSTLIYITIVLFLLFLIQIVLSGSILSRGLLVLPILFVIIASVIFYYLFKSKNIRLKILLSLYLLSFLLIWAFGSFNVFTRHSLHKSGLMDPVEEVITIVQNISSTKKENLIVINFDPVLTYYLANSELYTETAIISPYLNDTNSLLESVKGKTYNEKAQFDSTALLIFIQTYPGTLIPLKEKIDNLENYIFVAGMLITSPVKLGYDSDAIMKRRFFPSAGIQDWRFKIYILRPKIIWNYKTLMGLKDLKVY
jgi:uncharacterized membrane protein